MSREKKFHRFIESKNKGEKERVWDEIKEQKEEIAQQNGDEAANESRKKRLQWIKILSVGVVSIAVTVIGCLAILKFFPSDEIGDDGIPSGAQDEEETLGDAEGKEDDTTNEPTNDDENRYCDASMYTRVPVDKHLIDINEEEEKQLLYLNWYNETDYCVTGMYKFNETDEIIGYYEEIVDVNTGSLITIYILSNKYQLAELDVYQETTRKEYINNIEVNWDWINDQAYAYFEHKNNEYFIAMDYPIEQDSILDLVEELLP